MSTHNICDYNQSKTTHAKIDIQQVECDIFLKLSSKKNFTLNVVLILVENLKNKKTKKTKKKIKLSSSIFQAMCKLTVFSGMWKAKAQISLHIQPGWSFLYWLSIK